MAESNKRKSLFYLVLFAICLSFFNISCGLDVLAEVLDDPFACDSQPNYESTFETCYFSFTSRKLSNSHDMGRAHVYYKIYNDDQKAVSEQSTLRSKAEDSVGKLSSAEYMIDTYKYQPLHYIKPNDTSYSEFDLSNAHHKVRIRLTNYSDDIDAYSASIEVDGNKVGVPVRHNGKTFDFGRTGPDDENPGLAALADETSSTDTKGFLEKQEDGEENIFYVVLFAVFEMQDDSYKPVYSPIHDLGLVKIDANERNN